MATKTTRALTMTEAAALADKVKNGAKLTKSQTDAIFLTARTNDAFVLSDAHDILMDAIEAAITA